MVLAAGTRRHHSADVAEKIIDLDRKVKLIESETKKALILNKTLIKMFMESK